MKINVLMDYRGRFCSSVIVYKRTGNVTMDLEKLKHYASEEGIELFFMHYTDVDLNNDFRGQFFVYTSSEDPGLSYKGYLEDVLYSLHRKGAILLPEWRFMRAHHNKSLMEMLRLVELKGVDTGIHPLIFGCNEEFFQHIDEIVFPCVYKSSEGAGSHGVVLLKDREQAKAFLFNKSRMFNSSIKEKINKLLGRARPSIYSDYRNKFVIENFVPGLSGDYKVLVFGDKYYVLARKNRDNDFRASGGGKFDFEPSLPKGFFDYAESIYESLNVPFLSMDIAYDSKKYYLIEFQCCHFGTLTLENSTYYHAKEGDYWVRHNDKSILEKEYIVAIKQYIQKNFSAK